MDAEEFFGMVLKRVISESLRGEAEGKKQQTSSTKNLCACLVCENLSLMA